MCFLFRIQEIVWPAIHRGPRLPVKPAACLHSSSDGMTGMTAAVGFQVLAEPGEAGTPGGGGGGPSIC